MIFMSQSGLLEPARLAQWDAWYVEHLRIMRTVPGITSAQRFLTDSAGHSPSLAMYTVASPDVFRDPYYLSVRGMGEWQPLIDTRYYRRNLFSGLDQAPRVAAGAVLLVADRGQPDPSLGSPIAPATWTMTWLQATGLDMSTPYRGIAVAAPGAAGGSGAVGVAIYRPAPE